VTAFLRALVGLPPVDGESTVGAKRPAPRAVDANAWIGWALAGLYACALPTRKVEGEDSRPWAPPIRVVVREARRVAVVIAMYRHDSNLTQAAIALGTSRRALREDLKRAGLYPWGDSAESDDGSNDDAANASDDDTSTPTADAAKGGE